jgi:hypothetical protein
MGKSDYQKQQETIFQELEAREEMRKAAVVADILRAAKDRGFSIDDVLKVLDEPGMTNQKALNRILGL